MRPPLSRTSLLIGGLIVATLLGLGAAATQIRPTATGGIEPTASLPPTVLPSAVASPPVPTAAPTGAATAAPDQPVKVTLTSADPQPKQGGMIVSIDLTNNRTENLQFRFDPTHDLQVHDARGQTWSLRWAEYQGQPTIRPGQTAHLVRAFITGDFSRTTWPLTVIVDRVPNLGQAQWQVGQNGDQKPLPGPRRAPVPTVLANGPVSLSLGNAMPDSELGGVQIDLNLQNTGANDLVFRFDPNDQITATDSLGRPYSVRWAQYGGIVHVGPHATIRLARVFLSGPLASGNPSWIKVTLDQVPGTKPLQAAVGL